VILYTTEDGRTRIQCRFEDRNLWLTQAQMADLFQTTVPNINLHLKAIYEEGELAPEATIKSHLIVRQEGSRHVSRPLLHYSLPVVLAVGFRVKSHRGTQFRKWAIERLDEYLVKGFTMDDERLKNPAGPGQTDYFDELLARVREIRASERRFYQKVLDIYATSVDYQADARPLSRPAGLSYAAGGCGVREGREEAAGWRSETSVETREEVTRPARFFARLDGARMRHANDNPTESKGAHLGA
jgi:hypothetical protein